MILSFILGIACGGVAAIIVLSVCHVSGREERLNEAFERGKLK